MTAHTRGAGGGPMGQSECRFARKRRYSTRDLAVMGADEVKAAVESSGRRFDSLHPYRCPDGPHWHLSHYEQALGMCPVCEEWHPAWCGSQPDKRWIISGHVVDEQPCPGEGQLTAAVSR
ncbi:hypothetical protein [Mycolicibacterium senegalense]|nr:hypothetical protein [Mycolicibacterium senegalense]